MRWRVGIVLCLFVVYVGVGCRDPLTPNIDRNQAPETWITAAPFDTITIKNDRGNPVDPKPFPLPQPNTIPIRFHVYWSGADKDGAVAGFYWAVVETLPRPPPGAIFTPPLPGPKPQDYHFTTRTDSFFIFTVAEDQPDRQHAFFIYAVDNLGKPDPTPARFIFTALDRFPPIPIIEECRCTGRIYELLTGGGVAPREDTVFVTDIDQRAIPAPRDTCPAESRLDIKWRAEVSIPQTIVTGFRYKLDEPRFVEVGPEVRSVTYNSGVPPDTIPPASGIKIFTLRAVDQAFGTRDSTRRFQLNYSPDTWFSGPDLNHPVFQTKPNGDKYVVLVGGRVPQGITGSVLSSDSVNVLPALRPQRQTFFEIWKDTVWARQEGDTVHMNAWIVLQAGGYDRDSRYRVQVSPLAKDPNFFPDFPGGPVLEPGPANGSPIGFRSVISNALTPEGHPSNSSFQNVYPVFDPNSVFNEPHIAGYHAVFQAGRAFALMQAQDADRDFDRRVQEGRDLVTRIENGTATPAERSLRDKVLTFHVGKPPYLDASSPIFRPRLSMVDTFYTSFWDLRLVAADEDPFVPNTPVGGPSTIVTLRRRITILGKDASGGDFVYQDPTTYLNQQNINVLVPSALAAGPCTLEVELCDCEFCEDLPGTGRCVTSRIPVYYQPSSPAQPASINASRPGSEAARP